MGKWGGVIEEPPPFSHATRLKGSRRNGTSHYTGEEIEKEDIYVSKKKRFQNKKNKKKVVGKKRILFFFFERGVKVVC